MTPYELIVLGLATHQAISLWFNGGLFIRVRERIGHWHPLVAEGANCSVCMSVWCGAAVLAIWHVLPLVIWVLAMMAVAVAVQRVVR